MVSILGITAKEVQEWFSKCVAQTWVTIALTASKTLLPLPPIKSMKKMDPKGMVHIMETVVVDHANVRGASPRC